MLTVSWEPVGQVSKETLDLLDFVKSNILERIADHDVEIISFNDDSYHVSDDVHYIHAETSIGDTWFKCSFYAKDLGVDDE